MKTVLLVPGYQEDMQTRDYAALMRAIQAQGYRVAFVPIQWKRTTINDWTRQLQAAYATHDPAQTILAGFSFGSTTAFMAAVQQTPAQLWLFSLSPYFAADLTSKNMKPAWLKHCGRRRVQAFSQLHFEQLAQQVHCRTLLFVGQKEMDKWPIMAERAQDARQRIKHNRFIVVPGVGHDVAAPGYIAAIAQNI